MRRFRQALITVCIDKLLVFCQSAGSSASRGQKRVCAVLAVSRDTSFDMLGCGGDRNINLPSPPKKKKSLNESSDVPVMFASSLTQFCHSDKDVEGATCFLAYVLAKFGPAFGTLLNYTLSLFKYTFVCSCFVLTSAAVLTACMEMRYNISEICSAIIYCRSGCSIPSPGSAEIKIISCFVKRTVRDE